MSRYLSFSFCFRCTINLGVAELYKHTEEILDILK
jgi:hypothetical protein